MWQKLLGYLGVYLIEKIIKVIREAIADHKKKTEEKQQDKKEIEEINSIPDAAKRAERMQAKLDSLRNR
jgi:hypothetical protein